MTRALIVKGSSKVVKIIGILLENYMQIHPEFSNGVSIKQVELTI